MPKFTVKMGEFGSMTIENTELHDRLVKEWALAFIHAWRVFASRTIATEPDGDFPPVEEQLNDTKVTFESKQKMAFYPSYSRRSKDDRRAEKRFIAERFK